ncbi:GWxTD domain-containing protein [candidate division KSB1 bacterium]
MTPCKCDRLRTFSAPLVPLLIFLVFLLIPGHLNAQDFYTQIEENPFHVYFIKLPSPIPDTAKAVILMQIDYDNLRFIKEEELFIARYEISVDIIDGSGDIVRHKYWTEEIEVDNFDQTVTKTSGFIKRLDFNLKPALYRYVVQMQDTDSDQKFEQKGRETFSQYWGQQVGIGDILFTNTLEADSTLLSYISPDELIKVDFNEGFSAEFTVFNADLSEMKVAWKIYDFIDNEVPVLSDSMYLKTETHLTGFNIPFEGISFQPGIYVLRTTVHHESGKKEEKLQRFNFTWINRPIDSYDIDLSLEQMKYFLSDSDNDYIRTLTDEGKRTFFRDYWKDRDPFEETEVNELMEEYFHRIEYANKEFTINDTPGWKTNRGRIYCIYGKPDVRSVSRDLDINAIPIEVWVYYTSRKRFRFADRHRNGSFILISEEDISRD